MESVKGLKKLITVLEKVPKELERDVEATLEANAQEIEAEAKRLVPRDTGTLMRSIKALKVDNKTYMVKANATGLAPYAAYIEYGKPEGTGPNGGPKPYLFPAFFRGRRKFTDDLENLLDNTFGKI